MYQTLLFCHAIVRWLVLVSLMGAVVVAWRGYFYNKPFTKTDHAVRHWTATIAHIQLTIGILLFTQSPVVKYFWGHFSDAKHDAHMLFFGVVHSLSMLVAIVFITLGSSLAKRKVADRDKFRTMLIWLAIALVIIFLAIPWPFSPLAGRPYYRSL